MEERADEPLEHDGALSGVAEGHKSGVAEGKRALTASTAAEVFA